MFCLQDSKNYRITSIRIVIKFNVTNSHRFLFKSVTGLVYHSVTSSGLTLNLIIINKFATVMEREIPNVVYSPPVPMCVHVRHSLD